MSSISVTLPDRDAADLDLIAPDELAGFGEDQLIVAPPPVPNSR